MLINKIKIKKKTNISMDFHTDLKVIQIRNINNNKLHNLDAMDKISEMQNLPILTQEDIENLNGPITSKDIELLPRTFQFKKVKYQGCLGGSGH